jgi:hypothetical protein
MMEIKRIQELAGILKESVTVRESDEGAVSALYAMMDEGILDPRDVADAALRWMGDSEAQDFAHANEFPLSDEALYGDDEMEEGISEEPIVEDNNELNAITAELFDIAEEIKMSKDAKYMASYIIDCAKRLQQITGDQ